MSIFNESYLLSEYESVTKKEKSNIDFKAVKKDLEHKWKNDKMTPSFIKQIFNKIYRESPEKLIDDMPSISEVVRLTIVVGIPLTINPFIAIFTLLADRVIKDSVNAKFVGRYISQYKLQLHNIERQITKESDPEKLKSLNKVKENLERSISKLEDKKYQLDKAKDKTVDDYHIDNFLEESLDIYKFSEFEAEEALTNMDIIIDAMTNGDYVNIFEEEILNEGVKDKVKVATNNVSKKERKLDRWFEDSLKGFRQIMIGKEREKIITNGLPPLSKMVKAAIIAGAAYAINPAIAAIGIITTMASKKWVTRNEKAKILRELKQELEIVEEKIKHADASGDKEKKYQLMRLKNKLTVDIERIKGFY